MKYKRERITLDKYEYKVRAEEIKTLIAQGDYAQAAEIADTIDWRRVKSVVMLCSVSDVYKINRRYEDARDLLLMAYDRRPGGRNICSSLCELSIKTGEFVQAMEYYKEFVQAAPNDPRRYILQYKLYEDKDVSLEERIEVLEEYKKHEYRPKWAYELAYLYHRVGLATRCVEECDELILSFGEGSYVIKAMELKMLHQPLSAKQQELYDHRFDEQSEEDEPEDAEVLDEEAGEQDESYIEDAVGGDTQIYEPVRQENLTDMSQETDVSSAPSTPVIPDAPEELDIQVKTVDVGQYNTLNLQAELAQGLRELFDTESLDYPEIDEVSEEDLEPEPEEMESSEVFFGETGEIVMEQMRREDEENKLSAQETIQEDDVEQDSEIPETENADSEVAEIKMPEIKPLEIKQAGILSVEPPRELAGVLSQEADGQISLVVPEGEKVEKQITGQMSIADILAEWERLKKENEEKRKEDVRQRVLQQTGSMFTEFDAAVRDGLLEQLEKSAGEPDDTSEEKDETDVESGEETAETDNIEAEADAEPAEDDISESDVTEEICEVEDDVETDEESAADETELDEIETDEAEIDETENDEIENDEIETNETETGETDTYEEDAPDVTDVSEESFEAEDDVETDETDRPSGGKVRSMTKEEKEFYGAFIQSRSTKEQIIKAVDNMSLAAYTGNVIVTGEPGMDTIALAKNMIREAQAADNNFSGKVAKISGQGLNRNNVEEILNQLQNGALIVQNASDMDEHTVQDLYKNLQRESLGIVVMLEDNTKAMNRFLKANEQLLDVFTARVDVEALSNDMLVAFGKKYAREQEYSIDELGVLALHTRIEQRQTMEHAVTTMEVQGIVDGAIRHARRKTPGHFFDILLAKRYDEEDMIVVTEKDFV
jgi:tetratricopeptide (TPR) repeat protein